MIDGHKTLRLAEHDALGTALAAAVVKIGFSVLIARQVFFIIAETIAPDGFSRQRGRQIASRAPTGRRGRSFADKLLGQTASSIQAGQDSGEFCCVDSGIQALIQRIGRIYAARCAGKVAGEAEKNQKQGAHGRLGARQ